MIDLDFNQYAQKLYENDSTIGASEKFQSLLTFVKEKCYKDFNILKDKIGKGKGKSLDQNIYFKKEQTLNILDAIADEMTCPISNEPEDQLCILKCQHVISLNNLKKLKQKKCSKCPKCREIIEDNNIKYLLQNTIYKNLYSYLFNSGHIIESENSDKITEDESDSDNSEVDHILTKKKKLIREIKLNSNKLLQPIYQITNSKRQRPVYQNVIKELSDNNYEKAILRCQEYLKNFPKSYTMRCILAYTYRCLNNYEQALIYLNEAIELKKKIIQLHGIFVEKFFSDRMTMILQ